MNIRNGWKIAKIVGIAATILGGVVTALCDIPDLKEAIGDVKKPKISGPKEEEQ